MLIAQCIPRSACMFKKHFTNVELYLAHNRTSASFYVVFALPLVPLHKSVFITLWKCKALHDREPISGFP